MCILKTATLTRIVCLKKQKSFLQIIRKAITRKSVDSTIKPVILISKNDVPFLSYEGKGIRHIYIREFGFGITEDVPHGYNIALTGGWYKQLHLERAYAGADVNLYVVTGRGNVIQYFLRTGTFLNKAKIQDAVALAGVSSFSRIFSYKNLKMRQYLRLSYSKQFNRIGLDPLGINNVFGLPYISLDSARGNQRYSLHTETIFFLWRKVLGFKFAPFASADLALFTPEHERTSHSGFYSGFGGGMRTRNENLLFNTIELRFMYFPRKSQQHNTFKLTLTTNLHFRYNNSYVRAPDIIQVNSDYNNNIY